jgi:hypothetical protein
MNLETTKTEETFVSHELMKLHALLFKMVKLGRMNVNEAEDILERAGLFRVEGKVWTDSENSTYTLSE